MQISQPSRSRHGVLLALSAFVLTLTACGGSGGSTPEQAASAPPPVASDTPPPDPAPDTTPDPVPSQKVVVRGTVTDAPIPNARVTITVGGRVFEAPSLTDTAGAYEVEIDATDDGALVYCEAFDASGAVHLAAVPSTFGELIAGASDGAIDDMNITNLTTAHQVLVRQFLEDGEIQSASQLASMAQFVDGRALHEVAAAIKLVAEAREGITLPAGVANTLALAEAIVSGDSSFIDDVELTNPGAFAAALRDVITDGYALLPLTAANAAGAWVDQDGARTLVLDGDAGLFSVSAAGISAGSWTVGEDGRLMLSLGAGMEYAAVLARAERTVNIAFGTDADPAGSYGLYEFRGFDGAFDAAALIGTHVFADAVDVMYVLADGGGYTVDAASGQAIEDFSWSVQGDALVLGFVDRSVTISRLAGSVRGREQVVRVVRDADGNVIDVAVVSLSRAE